MVRGVTRILVSGGTKCWLTHRILRKVFLCEPVPLQLYLIYGLILYDFELIYNHCPYNLFWCMYNVRFVVHYRVAIAGRADTGICERGGRYLPSPPLLFPSFFSPSFPLPFPFPSPLPPP